VVVAPLAAFQPAKVQFQTHHTAREWTTKASLGHRWVKVKAFGWELETPGGKIKLERPVFPYKGKLVVPLRQVAEALGMKVHKQGQTIVLLPR